MKSSMHSQKVTSNSKPHILRESKVTYLLDPNSENNLYKDFGQNHDEFTLAA